MKVMITIPHGVAARNFLLDCSFGQSITCDDTLYVSHSLISDLPDFVSPNLQNIQFIDAPTYREGFLPFLLRNILSFAHLRINNTVGMQRMLDMNYRRIKRSKSVRSRIEYFAWLSSKTVRKQSQLRALTNLYVNTQRKQLTYQAYTKDISRIQPNVILCTDQRPPLNAALVAAAQRLNIPIGTFIFSWDNLSSKGRIPAEFDFYCVWSDLMKHELLQFYPHIDPDCIYVTGTPQFEPYFNKDMLLNRDSFCEKVGADPSRPIICYAGEDVITDPENPEHLAVLCELIRSGQIHKNVQVLVRPAPVDDGNRWLHVLKKYPDVLWCPPQWKRTENANWTQVMPTSEDVRLFVNIIRHCDCCVNMVSTVTLDFAIGDKPSVNIAFDIGDPPPHEKPVWDVLFQFEHYKPVVELGAAHIAKSSVELAEKVNLSLDQPHINREARRSFVLLETNGLLTNASKNIISVLRKVAAKP